MKSKILPMLFLVILISFLSTSYAIAQAGLGKARIGGVVVDEDGNPIEKARIVIEFHKNMQINRKTTTNKKGAWAIMGLGTGQWIVTASADGYVPAFVNIYVRQLERNPTITLTLKKIRQSDRSIIEDEASLNLIEKGNVLYNEKKYEEALLCYRQFLEKNPNAYQTYLNMGDCYREKGDFNWAMEEYNRVLKESQKDDLMGKEMSAKALAGIGECYLKKEDLETAQTYFKLSLETYPENEILAYNVGEIYFSNQKIDEAISYFELSTQIKCDWSDPYIKLGYGYLNKGDNVKAIENFEKFLELEPDSERSATVKNIISYLRESN